MLVGEAEALVEVAVDDAGVGDAVGVDGTGDAVEDWRKLPRPPLYKLMAAQI